ncbi:MAG: hypothetical protein PWQ82_489 [Thermosediminibacterales bacterium]|nr:hypothetical protein [Thermosediminibacterales bacterium]
MYLKKTFAFLLLILLILITGTCLTLISDYIKYCRMIFDGVYIYNISIGGKTKKEAEKILLYKKNEILNDEIQFKYKDLNWVYTPKQLGIDLDITKTVENAFLIGRSEKNPIRIILNRKAMSKNYVYLPVEIKTNKNFRKHLDIFKETVYEAPADARFTEQDNKIKIINSKYGRQLNEDLFLIDLKKALTYNDTKSRIVFLKTKTVKPSFTTEDAESLKINDLIAAFSTKFDKTKISRTKNITIAANKLNSCIIKPGEIFSFNDTIGLRSEDRGYEKAPVFINDKVELDYGGGICQVSSTLYNAALLADLEIIERANHSQPVSYVPLGRDATVVFDQIDLKFKNNTPDYLLLISKIYDDTLLLKLFGNKNNNIDVEINSSLVERIQPEVKIEKDANLKPGEIRIKEGRPGYKVKVWRIVKNTYGQIVKKELISTDIYKPSDTIIYYGK